MNAIEKSFLLAQLHVLMSIIPVAPAIARSPNASVILHPDVDVARSLEQAADFPSVASVVGLGRATATLIAPRWALTANHVVNGYDRASFEPPTMTLHFDGQAVEVEAMFRPPFGVGQRNDDSGVLEPDLALLRLSTPVLDVEPMAIHRDRDEVGSRVVLVGYGEFGLAGDDQRSGYGTRRVATNTIAEADAHWLRFRFDDGDAATTLEGVSAAGDSGGPALLEREGRWFVAGVSSHSNPKGTPNVESGALGVWEGYARVSSVADWIDRTIADVDAGRDSEDRLTRLDAPVTSAVEGLPQSAAGRLATGFLDAFSSGEEQRFVEWSRIHARRPRPDRSYAARYARYRARYGDAIRPVRFKDLAPDQILVEIVSSSGLREEMLLSSEGGEPPKVVTFGFRVLADR